MTRLYFIALALLAFYAPSQAAETPTYEVAYSSVAWSGVACTTGTVARINSSRPAGFAANVAGYRLQNQDSTYDLWVGGLTISTGTHWTQTADRGEKLTPGASVVYMNYKDYKSNAAALIPLACKCADGAAGNACLLSVVWFGY